MRDLLFISHANPEDNVFARWLALRLAAEGYAVWCDQTKNLIGADIWRDVDPILDQQTAKFLFVLSRTSNNISADRGYRDELRRANIIMRKYNLKDFIIPLHIDDLPFLDINIELARYIAAEFAKGWARGLTQLLDKLEKDRVPKNPQYTPAAVTSWWRKQFSADEGVFDQPEEYLSNWFPIKALPGKIYFHALRKLGGGRIEIPLDLPYPAVQHENYIVTFGVREDFRDRLAGILTILDSVQIDIDNFLEGRIDAGRMASREAKKYLKQILRLGWQQMVRGRGLQSYALAGGAECYYFRTDALSENKIIFTTIEGRQTYRKIVGRKGENFWHFAVQGKPTLYPENAYAIKSHVLFTDPEGNLFDTDRMFKVRRSACRNWWNDVWRDRMLAVMDWLACGKEAIVVQLASNASIEVACKPVIMNSPVSYMDPQIGVASSADEDYEFDYDEVEEDESGG